MADDNTFKNPHKNLLNHADGGDDDNDDEDCSEIKKKNIIPWQLCSLNNYFLFHYVLAIILKKIFFVVWSQTIIFRNNLLDYKIA